MNPTEFRNPRVDQAIRTKTGYWAFIPAPLLEMLRSYWRIENSLHYPRDVTLHEDQTRFKKHSAAHNMAIINNLVLSLIATSDFPFVPSARRFFAACPDKALALLLCESPDCNLFVLAFLYMSTIIRKII